MKTNMLFLFAIMGILMIGSIPAQQLVFADSDELEVEIEIEDGVAKIEVQLDDDEYEFKLATSDIDEILEVTSLRTGIPVDLLEDVMKLEVKDEHERDEHDDERDEDEHDDERDDDFKDIKTETLEKKLRASTIGDSSEVKIKLEFVTDTTDSELLTDEILEKFLVSHEEAEDYLKIQAEDDDELEDKFTVEIDTEDGATQVEVELRYVLDSTNRDDIISSIVDQSQLDGDILADFITVNAETDDDTDGFLDVSENIFDDSSDSGVFDDSDSEIDALRAENDELRDENQSLREEIENLKEQLANLNQVLMEQIRVIMDTLTALKS